MGTRDRILDAAVDVLRTRGQAGATTKEIARAAGCSEGSLYTYFATKADLLHAVMAEKLPPFIPLISALLERAGEDTVPDHLEEVARVAVPYFVEMTPLAVTVLASPDLNESVRQQGLGPQRANQIVASYLRLEQRLGRIRPEASVEAAAALLLGACQQRAMQGQFLGRAPNPADDDRFVKDLVATLTGGLTPGV
ncbi:MAG TPA: TetR/AcrR family transcriptional regulator [Chloroflexota bacterium]|jgi:AcrR family transcriptional regulator